LVKEGGNGRGAVRQPSRPKKRLSGIRSPAPSGDRSSSRSPVVRDRCDRFAAVGLEVLRRRS